MAEILIRENPETEKVFKLLNQLYSEKSGVIREMFNHRHDQESVWLLEAQLADIEFDILNTEEYLKEIINHKNN